MCIQVLRVSLKVLTCCFCCNIPVFLFNIKRLNILYILEAAWGVCVKSQSLSSRVPYGKDTLARYPEVLNRVWLQLMCCALLINLVPNFRARSKARMRLKIGARLEKRARLRIYVDFLTEEYRCISTAIYTTGNCLIPRLYNNRDQNGKKSRT